MEFKNSKTYQNVYNSCKGELIGEHLYMAMCQKANELGQDKLGKLFTDLSKQERGHSHIFEQILEIYGYNCELTQDEIDGVKKMTQGDMKDMLGAFINGEIKAGKETYPEYARIAEEEGFKEVAHKFNSLAPIEIIHGEKLREKLNEIY